jgi:hypothetical protein
LKSVHFGANNFYNEYPHAKALGDSLPPSGVVPRAARSLWVKVIGICFTGNGYGFREGVDEGALPYYKKCVENFTEAEIAEFLRLMEDPEFTAAFDRRKVDERVRALAKTLKLRSKNVHIQRALDVIINAPPQTLDRIADTTEYRNARKYIPKFK